MSEKGIRPLTPDEIEKAQENLEIGMAIADDLVQNPDKYPDDFIFVPLDSEIMYSVLTKERSRVLRALRVHGEFPSVGALAAHLEREITRVGRDVALLEHHGFVSTRREGKNKVVEGSPRTIVVS